MMHKRERPSVLERTLDVLDELGPRFGIGRAYLFGSLLQPNRFRVDSDIDSSSIIACSTGCLERPAKTGAYPWRGG
jgi:predicted nucleotidyltransferase